ncbi:MAG: beta-lactamase family protein, partial [Acidobacteria bacterium]|nr:beta-lactamase family protein [Acidobacteriota bacterium]
MPAPSIALAAILTALFLHVPQAQSRDPRQAQVDAVFAGFDKPDSPGCALGVIREGKLIYARGYGMANLEHSIPITTQTIFDLGSTSKQITAASIVLLAQEGKLALDDDVRKYVPEIPAYGPPITIRHLVHHTSGLRDYLTLMSLAGIDFDGVTGDEDALGIIARQKGLNFRPGEEHLYCNSGYFLLSVIVQRVSGRALARFAQERIFDPLGMKHTHYHNDHTLIVPGRATGYAPRKEGGFRIDMSGFEQTGDGAVMTSVEDLLLWDRNFYGPRLGGEALVRQLHEVGVLNSGEKLRYAFGLNVDEYRGLRAVSHGGSWAGYRAELLRFPDQNFSVACLCNLASANPGRLARQVAEVFLSAAMAAAPDPASAPDRRASEEVTLAQADLGGKAGLYRNPAGGEVRRITLVDGKLFVDSFGPSRELVPLDAARFRVSGPQPGYEVIFDSAGGERSIRLRVIREGSGPEVFESVEAAAPSADELGRYQGTYFSEELDARYRLVVEEEKLYLRGRNLPEDPLQPTFRDGFAIAGSYLEFARDADGA